MTILKIIEYPDPFLSLKAKTVDQIDKDTLKLIKDMADTMFNAPGVGLAAPQVRCDKRIIVYNPDARSERKDQSEKRDAHEDCEQQPDQKKESDNRDDHKENRQNKQDYRAIINPEIIAASGSLVSESEACLSVPDYSADVRRFSKVTVRGLNVDGKRVQFDAEDIQAVILQHEIDHLDGVLYIDRISILKRNMYRKRIKKRAKES